MCGIAGILSYAGATPESMLLDSMIEVMRYRGPDERGVFVDGAIGFGHARLSILDLAQGQQPMRTADGSLVITYNGEIFNFVELREQLIKLGYHFRTQSDTEVILHAYRQYGSECVHHLNGQWAFAIWDVERKQLFLSRDRMGVRPLFYSLTRQAFVFASEVKCVLKHPSVSRQLDPVGLDQVFTIWGTVAPRTMFEGISELPPGHSMLVKEKDLQISCYWKLDYPKPAPTLSAVDYAEGLRELLVDASRLRLRSDVPVGAYLSGGLDSSVIAGIIKKLTDTPMRTFSIAFDDAEFDESMHQREVSKYLGTEHSEFRCTYADIAKSFPAVIRHTEKPLLRTAPVPLFLLSRNVHESGYKVVLTGEGADEVLGGYDIYKEAKIRRFWAQDLASVKRPLLLKKLYPYLPNVQALPDEYLKAFFCVKPENLNSPLFSHLPRWEMTSKLKMFFSPETKSALRDSDVYTDVLAQLPTDFKDWDGFSQSQYLETTHLLPGYILSSQGDRVAMAHSVEGRYPFLDYRVVEFASKIPSRLKMKVLNEKFILKCAAEGLVPTSIRSRTKQPYRAPDARSFFPDAGKPSPYEYVEELLSPADIESTGVFSAPAVRRLTAKARAGRTIGARDNMAVVGILSTQLLVHEFLDK